MYSKGMLDVILAEAGRIQRAIEMGSGWEIWMQVELGIICRNSGLQFAREQFYPGTSEKLDFLVNIGGGAFAIELKVESATNVELPFLASLQRDIRKIASYHIDYPGGLTRWVIGIAYSPQVRAKLAELGNNLPAGTTAALYGESGPIGVIILTV